MKKIIAIIGMLLLTTSAEAATCDWAVLMIKADPAGGSATSATAYLVDNSVVALGTMTAALAIGDFSYLDTEGAVKASSATTAQATGMMVSETGIDNGFKDGTPYTFYTIVINNDQSHYLATSTVTDTGESLKPLNMAFGPQMSNNWVAIKSSGGGGEGVPEPTSGLLVIVGGALLALRRKQQ